jgi:hypothetical protein
LQRLSRDTVLVVPLVTPCPHCAARPHVAIAADHQDESQLHRIVDLKEEPPAEYVDAMNLLPPASNVSGSAGRKVIF